MCVLTFNQKKGVMRKMLVGALIVLVGVCMLSAPSVMAQAPCSADFTCDGDVELAVGCRAVFVTLSLG